ATGVNPTLNQRLNEIFRSGEASADIAEKLYTEFLTAQDANERISSVSQRMTESIHAVNEAIDSAMTTATAYSGALEVASGDLAADLSPDQLRAMALRLVNETRRMQDANHQLETRLE